MKMNKITDDLRFIFCLTIAIGCLGAMVQTQEETFLITAMLFALTVSIDITLDKVSLL